MKSHHLILLKSPPPKAHPLTDFILWMTAVITFSVGVYPLVWGKPVESLAWFLVGTLGLWFMVAVACKSLVEMRAAMLRKRLLLALIPSLIALVKS